MASVVLFHFKVPGFAGGFAGVDVFFAISGFLMTQIISNGHLRGDFKIGKFILARASRIFPALFVLVIAVLLLSLLLPPIDLRSIARYATFSLLFWSNQIFAGEQGYFAADSDANPFLHTWSLSVEWQFYLLLPLLLSVRPFSRSYGLIVLTGAFLASALFSMIETSATVRFFSLGTRAWEMAAGGLTFLATSGRPPAFKTKMLPGLFALSGFLLIFASFVVVDPFTPWPLPWAILPVVGTCMVIAANAQVKFFGWKPIETSA